MTGPPWCMGQNTHDQRGDSIRESRGPLLNYGHCANFQGDLILLKIGIMMIPKRRLRYLKREYVLSA